MKRIATAAFRVFLYGVGLIALVVVVILGGLAKEAVEARGYSHALDLLAQLGRQVLVGALVLFVADMAAMAIYTIRRGQSGGRAGRVVTANHAMPMSLGQNLPMGRSKRKILGSRNRSITMKSLVDGSAAAADRWMVIGIHAAVASFFFIFVGISLIGVTTNPISLAFMIVPGLWAANIAANTWRSYRRVKAGLPEDEV